MHLQRNLLQMCYTQSCCLSRALRNCGICHLNTYAKVQDFYLHQPIKDFVTVCWWCLSWAQRAKTYSTNNASDTVWIIVSVAITKDQTRAKSWMLAQSDEVIRKQEMSHGVHYWLKQSDDPYEIYFDIDVVRWKSDPTIPYENGTRMDILLRWNHLLKKTRSILRIYLCFTEQMNGAHTCLGNGPLFPWPEHHDLSAGNRNPINKKSLGVDRKKHPTDWC